MFKLSLPHSEPSSFCLSSISKVLFKVVMKQLKSISSGRLCSCCVELLQKKAVCTHSMASLRMCGSRSAVQNCNAVTAAFHIEYSHAKGQ